MKKIKLIILSLLFFLTGCASDKSDELTIMNIPLTKVESIDLYSKGTASKVEADDTEFLSLIDIIKENENKAYVIDGGMLGVMIGENADYLSVSEKYEWNIYIVNFEEKQHVIYSDFDSKSDSVTAIFIVPEMRYFGAVIQTEEGKLAYATLMNVDEDASWEWRTE